MRIGFHVSIGGSIDKAVDNAVQLGCTTFQIFTRNPRQWNSTVLSSESIKLFSKKIIKNNIRPIFAHMPYLPNLASPKDYVYKKSVKTLILELLRCNKLRIPYLVTHLGSHLGSGKENGFSRLIHGINEAIKISNNEVILLLENTAGTKNSMGSTLEDIQHIIQQIANPDRIGICFDTSHAFAAGYDLRKQKTIAEIITRINEIFGFEKLKLVHLNDSKGDLNSHIDRHEHIGLGYIGEKGFRNILKSKLGNLPLILETPKDIRRNDIDNLRKVKELADKS